jgi:hypothetical protein
MLQWCAFHETHTGTVAIERVAQRSPESFTLKHNTLRELERYERRSRRSKNEQRTL